MISGADPDLAGFMPKPGLCSVQAHRQALHDSTPDVPRADSAHSLVLHVPGVLGDSADIPAGRQGQPIVAASQREPKQVGWLVWPRGGLMMAHTPLQAGRALVTRCVQVDVACTQAGEGALMPAGSVSRWTGQALGPIAERQATCTRLHATHSA